jgi:poly(3-hydroxybutyrate) depolymerase
MSLSVLLLGALLPVSLPPAAREGRNLLANPGFEEGSKTPKGWEKKNPVPGVEYLWDAKVAGEGKRSLSLKKTVERYFPIAEWVQGFEHDGKHGKLHVGALIRAENAHKAILDAQFLDGAGEWTHAWAAYVGVRQQGEEPANHDWLWYSGVVAVPEGTRELRVGLQIYGPGQVWFDRVFAGFVDDSIEATEAARLGARPASEWGSLPVPASSGSPGQGSSAAEAAAGAAPILEIGGDPNRRYILNGPRAAAPAEGFRLLVVLPGGDGSADFRSFVSEIAAQACPESYLVAQAIAPVWSTSEERIVWPTKLLKDPKMEFPTEDFVHAIIADVRSRHALDPRHVFLLGWSSGGPPCYAASLEKKSPITGCLVAMSVFKPENLPSLKAAQDKAYYVLHSPEDFIAMTFPEQAVRDLAKHGARTTLATYAGGHGWHGDVHGEIARGLRWLEENSGR